MPRESTCLPSGSLNINCCKSGYGIISITLVSSGRLNVLACRPVVKHRLLLVGLRIYQNPTVPSACQFLLACVLVLKQKLLLIRLRIYKHPNNIYRL